MATADETSPQARWPQIDDLCSDHHAMMMMMMMMMMIASQAGDR